eukprot:521102-Pelagomonas_calceolata.AAC.1
MGVWRVTGSTRLQNLAVRSLVLNSTPSGCALYSRSRQHSEGWCEEPNMVAIVFRLITLTCMRWHCCGEALSCLRFHQGMHKACQRCLPQIPKFKLLLVGFALNQHEGLESWLRPASSPGGQVMRSVCPGELQRALIGIPDPDSPLTSVLRKLFRVDYTEYAQRGVPISNSKAVRADLSNCRGAMEKVNWHQAGCKAILDTSAQASCWSAVHGRGLRVTKAHTCMLCYPEGAAYAEAFSSPGGCARTLLFFSFETAAKGKTWGQTTQL